MTRSAAADRLTAMVALSCGDERADTLMRLTCARTLTLPPLPVPVDVPTEHTDAESVLVAFAEQFSTDVTGIGDNQRARFLQAFGADALRTLVMVYVADFVPRVWAGCHALDLGTPGRTDEVHFDSTTDPIDFVLNGFVPEVARMRDLDPVTTEVVRLRGAAAHNCRLCRSLRDRHALAAGGSEDVYDQIADFERAEGLSDAHKAALRYVDALIWSPSRIDEDVASAVRRHFSAKQALELTLDVMRNGANKILVSLGSDAARVSEGTELYEIDEAGQTVFA